VFEDIASEPVPSLLRGLSAPAILDFAYTPEQLALLLGHDSDGFNRWDAGQELASLAFDDVLSGNGNTAATAAWHAALGKLFGRADIDGALLATVLSPPDEAVLAERHRPYDPAAVHAAREHLLATLASHLGATTLADR